jgi:hypothetical protein
VYKSAGCVGFYSPNGGDIAFAQMNGLGVPITNLGQLNTNGFLNIGGISNFSVQDNGSGARLFAFQSNTFFYSTTANGNMFWNIAGAQALQLTAGGAGGIAVTGSLGQKASGTAWTNPSDERIKDVQRDYESGLDQILGLRPVVYTFKPECHQDDIEHVGLVAQEAEQVMPDLVTTGPGAMGEVILDDMKALDSSNVLWACVNAIKELKAENDALRTRIEALEAA